MTIGNYGQEMSAPTASSELLRVDEFRSRLNIHHHQIQHRAAGGQQGTTTTIGVKGQGSNSSSSNNNKKNIGGGGASNNSSMKNNQRNRRDESPDVTEGLVSLRAAKKGGSEGSSSSSSEMEEEEATSSSTSSEEEDGASEDEEEIGQDRDGIKGQSDRRRNHDRQEDDTSNDEGNSSGSSSSSRSCSNFPEFPPQLDFMGASDKSKRRTDRYDSSESSDSGVAISSPSTSDSTELISSPYSPCCDLSLDASSTISSSSSSGVGSSPSSNSNSSSSCCEDVPPSCSPPQSPGSSPPPPILHPETEPHQLSIQLQPQNSTLSPGTLLGHPIMTAVSAVLASGDGSSSSTGSNSSHHQKSGSKLPLTNFISFQIPTPTKNNNHRVTTTTTINQSPLQQYNNPIKLLSSSALSACTGISAGSKVTDAAATSTVLSNSLNCDVIRPSIGSNVTCATLSKLSNATISTSTGSISVNKSSSAPTAIRISSNSTTSSTTFTKTVSGGTTPVAIAPATATPTAIGGQNGSSSGGGSGNGSQSAMKNIFAAALNFHQAQQREKNKVAAPINNNNNNSTTVNKNHPQTAKDVVTVDGNGVGTTLTTDLNNGNSTEFQSSTLKAVPNLRGSATGNKSFILHGEGQKNKVIILSVAPGSKINSSSNSSSNNNKNNTKASSPSSTDLQSQVIQKSLNILAAAKAPVGITSSANPNNNNNNLSKTLKAISVLSSGLKNSTTSKVQKIDTTSITDKMSPAATSLANGTSSKKPRLSLTSPTTKTKKDSHIITTPKKLNGLINCVKADLTTKSKTSPGPKKTESGKLNSEGSFSAVTKARISSSPMGSTTIKKPLPISPTPMSCKESSGGAVAMKCSDDASSPTAVRNRKRKLTEDGTVFHAKTTTTTIKSSSQEVLNSSALVAESSGKKNSNTASVLSSSLSTSGSTIVTTKVSIVTEVKSSDLNLIIGKKSEKRLIIAKSGCASAACADSGCSGGIGTSIQSSFTIRNSCASINGTLKPLNQEGECMWEGCNVLCHNILEHIQAKHVAPQRKSEGFFCHWEGCKMFKIKSTSLSWIERHVLSHSGTKPYKCIFPGCGKSFGGSSGLAKHVDSHINTDGTVGGSHGSSSSTKNKVDSNSPLKISRRKKPRCRKQRLNIGQFVDYFDKRTMEVIKHRLATSMDYHTVNAHDCTFRGQVIATRKIAGMEMEVLVHWFPESIIPDEWMSQSKYKQIKLVPLTRIPKDKLCILFPTLLPQQRKVRAGRKFKGSSSSASSCYSSANPGSISPPSSPPLSPESVICESPDFTKENSQEDNTLSNALCNKIDDDEDEGVGSSSGRKRKNGSKNAYDCSPSKKKMSSKTSSESDEDEDESYANGEDVDDWATEILMDDLHLASFS